MRLRSLRLTTHAPAQPTNLPCKLSRSSHTGGPRSPHSPRSPHPNPRPRRSPHPHRSLRRQLHRHLLPRRPLPRQAPLHPRPGGRWHRRLARRPDRRHHRSNPETASPGAGIPGTYAQFAVAPVDRLVNPRGVTSQQAAAAMHPGHDRPLSPHSTYAIQPQRRVLIHAGAGGTGLLLIQMAKSLGARVFTTVSTEEKAALARAAGADEVILYTAKTSPQRSKRLPPGRPPSRLRLRRQIHLRAAPFSAFVPAACWSSSAAPAVPSRPSISSASPPWARSTSPAPRSRTTSPPAQTSRPARPKRPQRRRRRHPQAPHRTHLPPRRSRPRPPRSRIPQNHRQTPPHSITVACAVVILSASPEGGSAFRTPRPATRNILLP